MFCLVDKGFDFVDQAFFDICLASVLSYWHFFSLFSEGMDSVESNLSLCQNLRKRGPFFFAIGQWRRMEAKHLKKIFYMYEQVL